MDIEISSCSTYIMAAMVYVNMRSTQVIYIIIIRSKQTYKEIEVWDDQP